MAERLAARFVPPLLHNGAGTLRMTHGFAEPRCCAATPDLVPDTVIVLRADGSVHVWRRAASAACATCGWTARAAWRPFSRTLPADAARSSRQLADLVCRAVDAAS